MTEIRLFLSAPVTFGERVWIAQKKQELLPLPASNYSATQKQGQTPEQGAKAPTEQGTETRNQPP